MNITQAWIFLYGPPGSGKSTLGNQLAQTLALPFYDLDQEIEVKCAQSIPEIFVQQGEAAFRELESEMLFSCLQKPPGVLALGGGTLLREANRCLVEKHGKVVCFNAPLETLAERIPQTSTQRPLIQGNTHEKLAGLLAQRSSHYTSFSIQISSAQENLTCIVEEIQRCLGRFRVQKMPPAYDVIVQPGKLIEIGLLLRERKLNGPVGVVTDTNTSPLYRDQILNSLDQAGYFAQEICLPAGEEHKTIQTIGKLWDGFLSAGLDRSSTVLAAGGGVVSDLAGFAAATYLRGIAWAIVPTSLLSMADACLGGKTGADLPQGKNLIGAFYPPRLILADPETLQTLPEREFRSGMAEVVKSGLIGDEALFNLCSQGLPVVHQNIEEIIRRSMAVKIHLIEADPYEKGQRAALNLGHTIGHALESASGYRLTHGEAVGIGLIAEARLAEESGIASSGLSNQIAVVIQKLGLPVVCPYSIDPQTIYQAMQVDKKKHQGTIQFALPAQVGNVKTGVIIQNQNLILEAIQVCLDA